MASLTLSNTTMTTSLSNIKSLATLATDWLSLSSELQIIAYDMPAYSSTSATAGGKTTWKDPVLDTATYTGNIKEYTGSFVQADIGDKSINATKLSATKTNGDALTIAGTIKASIGFKKEASDSDSTYFENSGSYAYTLSKVTMANANGTSYEISGKVSYSYSYTFEPEKEVAEKFSVLITSLKSTDASGNSVTFTGKLTYSDSFYSDLAAPVYEGTITGFSATLGGQKVSATGLKLTYNEMTAVTADGLDDYLPLLLGGNDTLKVSATDPLGTTPVYGYAGNDKITGSTSDDILIGGAGADQLTGGSGADTFRFTALADLGTSTTTRDTLKDFKTSQSDKIDFSGMGTYTLYASTSVAALSDASNAVWFDKGVLYLSTDTDTDAEYQIALTGVTSIAATDFVSILSIT
jgi:Ca2+-binding RTX toxin-like protein